MKITNEQILLNVYIVRGYKEGDSDYSFTATVINKGWTDGWWVYGLLSRKRLGRSDLNDICRHIGALADGDYVHFETLRNHWRAWKPHLNLHSIVESNTIDNKESYIVEVTYKEEE